MNIEFRIGSESGSEARERQSARQVLLIANFSGAAAANDTAGMSTPIRNMFTIDPLDLDAALARIRPQTTVGTGDQALHLVFEGIDDFHPDSLFASQPVFQTISELKRALSTPGQADGAARLAEQLLGDDGGDPGDAPPPAAPADQANAQEAGSESDDMFARLLGKSATKPGATSTVAKSAVERILKDAISDNEAVAAPEASATLAPRLEELATAAMREILRDENYRQLESAWRAVRWLGENVELDEDTTIWLADIGRSETTIWAEALPRAVGQAIGTVDLVVVLDEYGDTPGALGQLASLAKAAQAMNAPTFAAASESLAGLSGSFDSALALDASDFNLPGSPEWELLRTNPAMQHVALGFPGLLLRQPYGSRSDPIDAFKFEELEIKPPHDAFSWGNPAIAMAAMWLQDSLQVHDLPMVVYDDGSGQSIKPPTESYLADSAADSLIARGITPLLGARGQTDVRVPRLQSASSKPVGV